MPTAPDDRVGLLVIGGVVLIAAVGGVVAFTPPPSQHAPMGDAGYLATACSVEELKWPGEWDDDGAQVISPSGSHRAGTSQDSGDLVVDSLGDVTTVPIADSGVAVRDINDSGIAVGQTVTESDDGSAAWVYRDGDVSELTDDEGSPRVTVAAVLADGTVYGEAADTVLPGTEPDEGGHGDTLVWEPGETTGERVEPLDLKPIDKAQRRTDHTDPIHFHVLDATDEGTLVGEVLFADPKGNNQNEYEAWLVPSEAEPEEMPFDRTVDIERLFVAGDWVLYQGIGDLFGSHRWHYTEPGEPEELKDLTDGAIAGDGTVYSDHVRNRATDESPLPGLDELPLADGGNSRGGVLAVSLDGGLLLGHSNGEAALWDCDHRGEN